MTQPPADEAAPQAGETTPAMRDNDPLPAPEVQPGESGADPAPPAVAIDFAELVPRYESALLRYVGQLIGRGDHDVEDIVQDAFLRLHRHVHEHGPASIQNVSTWLFRVAHNLTMDTLRKRKVRRAVQQKLAEGAGHAAASTESHPGRVGPPPTSQQPHPSGMALPDDTLGDMERREACQRAMAELRTLPDHQREALTLKMIEGMTIRQIAEVTHTSIGNVGYRIAQGLAELSRRLKQAGVI